MEGRLHGLSYFAFSGTDFNFSLSKKPRGSIFGIGRRYYAAYNETNLRSSNDPPVYCPCEIRSSSQSRHCDCRYRSYLHLPQSSDPCDAQRVPEGQRPVRDILRQSLVLRESPAWTFSLSRGENLGYNRRGRLFINQITPLLIL